MEPKQLTITRDGIEAAAHYTGRSVEVDLYRHGAHLNHISGMAEWQHYTTVEEMLTAAAENAITAWIENRYQIQTERDGRWTNDGIGENPPRSPWEARSDLMSLRELIPAEPSWAKRYRIVRLDADGGVADVVEEFDWRCAAA